MSAPTVLGLDLSLNATGFTCWDPRIPSHVDAYTLSSDTRLPGDHPARWHQIICQILPFVDAAQGPVIATIEGLFPTIKGNSHDWLVGLRSATIYELHKRNVHVVTVANGTLKIYATGSGRPAPAKRTAKQLVFEEVRARYRHIVNVANDNEAEALVLLAMTLDHYGRPLVQVPATHRRALTTHALKWPNLGVPTT